LIAHYITHCRSRQHEFGAPDYAACSNIYE